MTKRTKALIRNFEREIECRDDKITRLKDDLKSRDEAIHELEKKLVECNAAINTTPSDCKPGSWCEACSFRKTLRVNRGFIIHTIHVCGKGGACSNFVQEEM